MKILKWKKDKFFSTQGSILKYDKLEHFLLAFTPVFIWLRWGSDDIAHPGAVMTIVYLLGLAWEVRDGYKEHAPGKIQGFSYKDLIANTAGIIAAMLAHWLIGGY